MFFFKLGTFPLNITLISCGYLSNVHAPNFCFIIIIFGSLKGFYLISL